MNDTLNDKIKKLVSKFNSIQGSLANMGKRVKALEESEKDYYPSDPNTALIERVNHIWNYLGLKLPKEEAINREGKVVELKPDDSILGRELPDEEIEKETLDALDEVIE